jgi:hypothetical protein
MITKKDFAEYLIEEHADSEEITVDEVKTNPTLHVYKSTSCGLALEYLGLLDGHKGAKEYLANRAGSFISIFGKENESCPKFLSTRDMFSLLPDTLPQLSRTQF